MICASWALGSRLSPVSACRDPSVSADPDNARFSFSFGGRALFVVGVHPQSSRLSRRFRWPAMMFNPRAQFERLRAEGRFDRLRDLVPNHLVSCDVHDLPPALAPQPPLPERRGGAEGVLLRYSLSPWERVRVRDVRLRSVFDRYSL